MLRLDPNNKDEFTTSGLPQTNALEAVTGIASIPAAERTALWEGLAKGL